MKYHFFTINALQPTAGEKALNAFCAQRRVVTVDKHVVAQGVARLVGYAARTNLHTVNPQRNINQTRYAQRTLHIASGSGLNTVCVADSRWASLSQLKRCGLVSSGDLLKGAIHDCA